MDVVPKNRRRSSTTTINNMVAGVGGVRARWRGSSYQGGDDMIPADLLLSSSGTNTSPSNSGSANRMSSKHTVSSMSSGSLHDRLPKTRFCQFVLSVLVLFILYLLFAFIFDFVNTENPCVVARRSLKDIARMDGSSRDNMMAGWEPKLPKIIHQQWKGKTIKNEKYLEWQAQWKMLYPSSEFEYILWTDESMRELIKEHYSWFLSYYDGYKFNIQRADAVRYFIMYHYGGVYADLDYEPLHNFWGHLPKDRVSLIESPYLYNELVQNSLMTSPKNDLFWLHAFKILVSEYTKPVLSATGPVFLDTVVKTNKEPFHKLPCENFQRIPMGEHKESPYLTLLHREVLGRLFPMKQCGAYADLKCQLGRHHNTASYLADTGLLELIWT